ncbi:zinc ribbon domain-containing protein [Mangrovibacter yixingensis]|uniref:zinc ribbon domain-containing protein n=1 Tax=Mangrovibacter yixingensis TaxID=1529639 RepID=UPI001CFE4E87|nr:zinc ribbon domain-containing protein [Mangrovibacter yixingensis]
MEYRCPECQGECTQQGEQWVCEKCHETMVLQPLCPECHKPLEVLKACGAVDYFCQNGHGLISKKRVDWQPVAG